MDTFEAPHGKKTRGLANEELARLVRLDLARALKTVNRYSEHLEAAQDKAAAKVLEHLRNEEKHHFGELLALLQYLDPEEGQNYAEGAAEATKLLMQLGIDVTTTGSEAAGSLVVTKPAPLVPLCDVPVKPGAQFPRPQGGKPTKKDRPKKGRARRLPRTRPPRRKREAPGRRPPSRRRPATARRARGTEQPRIPTEHRDRPIRRPPKSPGIAANRFYTASKSRCYRIGPKPYTKCPRCVSLHPTESCPYPPPAQSGISRCHNQHPRRSPPHR